MKASPPYPRGTSRAPVPDHFELLRAAHRGQMVEMLASGTADRLRTIAQLVGLSRDTAQGSPGMDGATLNAMHAADASLQAEIEALDWFTQRSGLGPVDLRAAITTAVTGSILPGGPRTGFEIDIPARIPAVASDPADLVEMLFAIFRHARESVRDQTRRAVQVSVTIQGERVLVTVRAAFTAPAPSRRGFDTAPARAGNENPAGIGLAVARRLARSHGGDLRYEQRARGMRFVLTLARWRRGGA